jgi:hypothetical protein
MRYAARTFTFLATVGAVTLLAGSVSAVVLTEGTDQQKHRKDVAKQTAKYVACAAKNLLKCEKKGADSGPECDLANPPASTIPDADAKAKFVEKIAKCVSKVDLLKKGPDLNYVDNGCPGDSNPGTPAVDEPFTLATGYTELQAALPAATAAAIGVITPTLQALCGGVPATSDELVLDCINTAAAGLLKYTKGVTKCQAACENDYDGEIGNGGTTDDESVCSAGVSANGPFNTCVSEAQAKAEKKIPTEGCGAQADPGCLNLVEFQILEGAVNTALNDTKDDGYNECDCGAGIGPCP